MGMGCEHWNGESHLEAEKLNIFYPLLLIKGSCGPTRKCGSDSGNRNAELASNYATRIRGRHTGMKCDVKGIEHCSHCVGWPRSRNDNRI